MTDLQIYECLAEFRRPLFIKIFNSLEINYGSNGLDACCGTGTLTRLLSNNVGKKGHITGLDVSAEFIKYAKNNNDKINVEFVEGDINSLEFVDNTFNWIISTDGIWPGPAESGCPSESLSGIINDFYRILIPGGRIFLLYWTSQKLLCGYPILEARLNTTSSATAPFIEGMSPVNHILNAKKWLGNAGFSSVYAKSYLGDIESPLSNNDKESIKILMNMLWEKSGPEVSKEDWELYRKLASQDSGNYILNNKDYYGFYTYTLFTGTK